MRKIIIKNGLIVASALVLFSGCASDTQFTAFNTKNNLKLNGIYKKGNIHTGKQIIEIGMYKGSCNISIDKMSGFGNTMVASLSGLCFLSDSNNSTLKCNIKNSLVEANLESGTCFDNDNNEYIILAN